MNSLFTLITQFYSQHKLVVIFIGMAVLVLWYTKDKKKKNIDPRMEQYRVKQSTDRDSTGDSNDPAMTEFQKSLDYFQQKREQIESDGYVNPIMSDRPAKNNRSRILNEIKSCEKALKVRHLSKDEQYEIESDLASLYMDMFSISNVLSYLSKARKLYQTILKKLQGSGDDENRANTLYNLGHTFETTGKINDDQKDTLLAVDHYQQALVVWTEENFLIEHTMCQESIGKLNAEILKKNK